eukprot:4615997-Alexandrium_andersonii.AAC.1
MGITESLDAKLYNERNRRAQSGSGPPIPTQEPSPHRSLGATPKAVARPSGAIAGARREAAQPHAGRPQRHQAPWPADPPQER